MRQTKATLPANDVRQQAARWFARTRSGDITAAETAERDAWLAADARHAYEFQMLQSIWTCAGEMPAGRLRALAEPPARRVDARRRQALLVLTALVAGAGAWAWQRGDTEYRTAVGERRTVSLPDGSTAELNSDSHLRLSFDGAARRVVLLAGEAMFSVQKDSNRPFVVDSGLATVTVTGTRFDVLRDAGVQVVVEEGSVAVAGKAGEAAVMLAAGQMVVVDAQGRSGQVMAARLDSLLAWRKGQIVFSNTALAAAAHEVSRYRQQAIVLAPGQGLEALRLSSVFQTADTDAFLTALPHILPVKVAKLADGRSEIRSAVTK